MDVAATFDQITVLGLLIDAFLLQGFADLTVFVLDKRVIFLAVCVILREDLPGQLELVVLR
jgi:hypothetical protein